MQDIAIPCAPPSIRNPGSWGGCRPLALASKTTYKLYTGNQQSGRDWRDHLWRIPFLMITAALRSTLLSLNLHREAERIGRRAGDRLCIF